MSYKIKSLLYFICFLVSILIYNNLSEDTVTEEELLTTEPSKANVESLAHHTDGELISVQ